MAAPYRHYIQPEADAQFPAEAGRYHLYVTYSCPFACRALAARNLKGLEDVISLSVAHPVFQKTKPNDDSDDHKGWTFVDPATDATFVGANGQTYSTEGCIPDTVNHTQFVRDLYELVDKEPRRFTVPLLWDKKTHTIVSNESADILRTLNSGFRDIVPSNVDLLPAALVSQIEALNDGVIAEVGAAAYRVRSKETDDEYNAEIKVLFAAIAKVDALLATTRFLVGSVITEADIRLFHTLIRVDLYQRTSSKHTLLQFANVVHYLRDLYQTPALQATVNWDHLKIGGQNYNAQAPLPEGPFVDYDAPHDRSRL